MLLQPGGRTAFYTIYVPRGLDARARRRARAAAPKYGWSRADHLQLMRSAGFVEVEEIDRTAEYRETLAAWYDAHEQHAQEMRALVGSEAFDDRQRDRRAALAAVDDGLQRRVLMVGVAPAALPRRTG